MDDTTDIRTTIIAELEDIIDVQKRFLREDGPATHSRAQLAESVGRLEQCADRLKAEVPVSTDLASLAQSLARIEGQLHTEKKTLPLLSKEAERYLTERRKDKPDSNLTKYTLPAATAAFLQIIGDKPIDEYRAKDLKEFGRVLARVPANRAKIKRFSRMSYEKAGDLNAGLKEPFPTLTSTSIQRQYMSPIKSMFEWLCTDHLIRSPLEKASTMAPPEAREGIERQPLSNKQAARLLEAASRRARPDEKWLPLLGLATGCRLAELIYLQGRDIKWNKEAQAWTFDLTTKMKVRGREVERPLKNKPSRRIIAIPHFVVATGFVDWARERPGFIFDQLHRRKRPGGTASKRMAALLDSCGIIAREEVFHSLRHTHKDWLRDLDIRDRTIDMQSGHAHKTVAAKYGSSLLSPKQIKQLAACELPPDIPIPERYKVRQFPD